MAACCGALLLGLAGCVAAGGPPPAARLTIALPQEPQSLNPLFLSGAATATIVPMIYSYLLTLDEHNRLRPDLAVAVPTQANGGISRDGKTIVYRLRRAAWQDGAPVTAADVAFTFQAIMNPRNNVVSRSGYDAVASVEAIGARTVRVRLRRPYAPILSTFLAPNQNYGVLPAHLLRGKADLNHDAYDTRPIGSGPYRVVEWLHGDHLRLERNRGYYGGAPSIAEIDLRFVADSTTILNQLRTGEIDVALVADPNLLAQYGTIRRERVVRAPLAGVAQLFFNVRDPDLADVRVRRALVEALDLPRAVRDATKGAERYADAGRGLFSWGYDPAIAPPPFDPAGAARLLDAAGWRRAPGGMRTKGGRALALELAFVTGNPTAASLGLVLQQQLRAAGVQLALHAYNPTEFRAPGSSGGPLFGGRYQLAFLEIYTPADPDTAWFFGCSQIPPNGFNVSRWCDPATDRAELAGTSTYDPAQRRRDAALVQRRVAAELPSVSLWQQNAVYVVPATLREFRPAEESPVWNVGTWRFDATPRP
ncbi:MAG TPA: peptide ABC transporter substrate-binding protein [Candidatus Baltobacteraceae bacterium]|nr:peptide ABC transporter substrate-binding protein [Candidatus Baltobacteraceae bacterium]